MDAEYTGDMRIFDSHHHYWDPGKLDYPWLRPEAPDPPFGDKTPIAGPYLPADYARDCGELDVIAAVHVQAECAVDQALTETRWLAQLATIDTVSHAYCVHCDPRRPDFAAALDAHMAAAPIQGVRLRLNYDALHGRRVIDDPAIMADPAFRRGLAELARRNLNFELSLFPNQMGEAERLCAALPDLRIALNHLGTPLDASLAGFGEWSAGMRGLARRDNVHVKISGLWQIDRAWNQTALAPWVLETISLFGPDRCFYGSNLPIEKLMCPMPRQIETLADILAGEPAAVLAAVFAESGLRFYQSNSRMPITRISS